MRLVTPAPLTIPLPDITIKVLDLFVDEPPTRASRKRCRTRDNNPKAPKRDEERLEREQMKATRRAHIKDEMVRQTRK